MKSFYKYLIFFILGIILCIIFKKRIVEGYPDACSLTPNKETCVDKKDSIVHVHSTALPNTLNTLIDHGDDSIIEIPNYKFQLNELFNTSGEGGGVHRYTDWNIGDRDGLKTIRGYAPFAFGEGEVRNIKDIPETRTSGRTRYFSY